MTQRTFGIWSAKRPRTMVVACSDGRLQSATDDFLLSELGLAEFDRLYVPGGGGALSASDRDLFRAQQLRGECRYLVELHEVQRVILLFHGPAVDGPAESVCAGITAEGSNLSREQVLDGIGALVELHLVEPSRGDPELPRFTLLEAPRAYATELLEMSGG